MPIQAQLRSLSIDEDPLREILQLEEPKTQEKFDRSNFGDILQRNERVQKFLGLGSSEEEPVFETPEMEQFGEDYQNGEIFRDAVEDANMSAPRIEPA